ncbi:MAG: hypothetical protein PHH00_02555 [Candidatus Nanoarchaeia archaeon]|nr:hypothetical protein [Candidatus Nanoarchaeia archaeon]
MGSGESIKSCADDSGQEYCLVYQPQGMSYKDSDGEHYLSDIKKVLGNRLTNKVTYSEIYPSIDLTYEVHSGFIKENYVIKSLPELSKIKNSSGILSFGGYIEFDNLDIYADGIKQESSFITSESIDFRNPLTNKVLFNLPKPVAYDSSNNSVNLEYEIQVKGDKKMLYVQVPYSWLSDSLRVYPVFVDPSISYGSEYVFNSANTAFPSISALNSTSFVISYNDITSGQATSRIGTVSGTTIAYGSEYALGAIGSSAFVSVSALNSTSFVLSYTNSSAYGLSAIGRISGTTISYGTKYSFSTPSTLYPSVSALNSTYFVVAFRDQGSSSGSAVVGRISSGTTIAYGSEYEYSSVGSTTGISVSSINSTYFVVSYTDDGNSNYGTAVVGRVSGTTISFGSEYVFNSASTPYTSVSALDSTHVVVSYGNSSYGKAKIGTISGTTISFGSEYVFNSASTSYVSVSSLDSTHFVVSYTDAGNSSYGTAVVGRVSGTTISFGSEYVFNPITTSGNSVSSLDSVYFVSSYTDSATIDNGTAIIGMHNTCTCPTVSNTNWEINMAQYCILSTTCNLGTGNLTFYGTGNFTANAMLNTRNMDAPPDNSIIWISSNARVFIG